MLDGAATGAAGGALFGGIGAIPGAIGGGLLGLANGLWDKHDESVARDGFMGSRHDDGTVNAASDIAAGLMQGGMSEDEAIQSGANQVFLQQRAAQQEAQGSSLFDRLF